MITVIRFDCLWANTCMEYTATIEFATKAGSLLIPQMKHCIRVCCQWNACACVVLDERAHTLQQPKPS